MTASNTTRPNLWRNRDFCKLWAGQTVSTFGSLVTRTALPFVAVLLLKATPMQMAWLGMTDLLAGLLVGLFAGVVVDRFRRRPLLIATDIARAALVLTVPLLAVAGLLRIELLYLVAFLTGLLSTIFDIAHAAYLPTLIARDDLLEGNSKMTATASAAEILAFGSGGWLVQILGAPYALLVDAVTFIVSAASLLSIRKPEARQTLPADDDEVELSPLQLTQLMREAGDGLRVVWKHPELRALALSQWMQDLGGPLFGTLFLLFVTRELGVPPGVQGTIYAIGGFTSLAGAVFAERVTRRLGFGRAMTVGLAVATLGMLWIPLAPQSLILGAVCLITNQLLTDPAATLVDIGRVSLRQVLVSDALQGRVVATFRVGGSAAALLGTFAAGILGEHIGLRGTLLTGVAVTALAPLFIAFSPLMRRKTAEVTNVTV